jgi:photosystem II stability/assembly factor-like uncharacterized protein
MIRGTMRTIYTYFLFIFFSIVALGQSGWIKQNSGTNEHLISVYFTDSLRGVVIGHNGTILRTTNGGEEWIKLPNVTTNNLSYISFVDSQTGTIVGGGGTILRTEDGGDTWFKQESGVTVSLSAVSFYDKDNGIAVGGSYGGLVLRTKDGGDTWEIMTQGEFVGFIPIRIHYPDSNNIAVIAFSSATVVYNSTDGGISWNEQMIETNMSSGRLNDATFINTETGFLMGWNGRTSLYYSYLYKTIDGGKNWVEILDRNSNKRLPTLNAISFSDENTGVAVGMSGRIFRTTNGGTDWTQQYANPSYTFNDVFFSDSKRGAIVGSGGIILRTNTGGISYSNDWEYTYIGYTSEYYFDPVTLPLRDIHIVGAETGICTGFNVFKTTDGGMSWNESSNGIEAFEAYGVWMDDFRNGSVVGKRTLYQGGRMYNTTDGGDSWDLHLFTGDLIEMEYRIAKDIYYVDNLHRIIIAQYGRILYTSDGGETWIKTDSVTAWDLNDLSFANSEVGFVVGDKGTILKTTTGGRSWNVLPTNTTENLYGVSFKDVNNGLIVSRMGTILRTTDSGISWYKQESGTYNDLYKISFDNNGNGLIVGELGIILKTSDGGETWVREESGTSANLNAISFNDSIAIAVGEYGTVVRKGDIDTSKVETSWTSQFNNSSIFFRNIFSTNSENSFCISDSMIFRSSDSGISWELVHTTEHIRYFQLSIFDISFSDTKNGSAIGGGGLIVNTTDGGESWFTREFTGDFDFMHWRIARGIFKIDSLHQVIVGDIGTIIYTSNGGNTWERPNSTTNDDLNDVFFVNSSTGFIAGKFGTILKTNTGGLTWSYLARETTNSLSGIFFTDSLNGYVVGGSGTLLMTTNGGESWKSVETETSNDLNKVCFRDKNIGFIVGDLGTILSTANGGESWRREYSGTSYDLYGISVMDSVVLAVGFNGNILRKIIPFETIIDTTIIDTTTIDTTLTIPTDYQLKQNYPNPFNPTTTIEYSIPKQSKVTVKVFDLLGREIATLVDEEKTAGNYMIDFNGSNLSSGIYFYRLDAGGFSETRKLILIR